MTSHELIKAQELLAQGNLVAIPTETVYGLAADATNDLAVAKIFHAKGRPTFNPLIIHVASVEQAKELAEFTPLAEKLVPFWPGPLTLVLQRKKDCPISELASAGLETIALRIPHHPVTLELLKQFKKPLAAPSANRSNTLSPTSAQDVKDSLKENTPFILDAGPCSVGLESTIVDATGTQAILLRPGGLSLERLEALIGPVLKTETNSILAPGMMKKHYAPHTPLRLNAHKAESSEVMLGFGNISGDLNLSPTGNLEEAASNLFRMLRELDQRKAQAIAVAPVPQEDLGLAINDRLQRASANTSDDNFL